MTLAQPHIEPHPTKEGIYILLEDFSYEWIKNDKEYQLREFAGFEFDLASVPRFLWTVSGITPGGLKWTPPFWHDAGYKYKGKFPPGHFRVWDDDLEGWVNVKRKWKRKQLDKLFCRLMREDGISVKKRRKAYWAVRIGGLKAWLT